MQVLLLQLYYHVSQQSKNLGLNFCVLVEEAHNILLKHGRGYETVMELVLRQVREYGVGICLLDQHPSLLAIPSRGSYCTIAFNLPAHEDMYATANSMALGADQEYLSRLEVGQAIVKLRGRFLKPFLASFPKVNLSKEQIYPGKSAVTGEENPILSSKGNGSRSDLLQKPVGLTDLSQNRPNSGPAKHILEKAKRLLIDVVENPVIPTSARYLRLGWNPKVGNEIKRMLIESKIVVPVILPIGKTRVVLLQPTGFGKQTLREIGIHTRDAGRRGSLEHQFWCHKAKEHFEKKGFGVLEEVKIGAGKAVDLVAIDEKDRIAIEIETGKSDVVGNVRKCDQRPSNLPPDDN